MIERIKVNNLVNKYNYDFKLLPGLNFIVGLNGYGKTVILNSIHDLLAEEVCDGVEVYDYFALWYDGNKYTRVSWLQSSVHSSDANPPVEPGYFSYEKHKQYQLDHGEWFKNNICKHIFASDKDFDPSRPLSRGETRLESLYEFIEGYLSEHNGKGTLLLDGIDEGLHVCEIMILMKNIKQLIKDYDVQVIIATHSPTMIDLDDWNEERVIDLYKNNKK